MLILCTVHRKGGTTVDFNSGNKYHFKPLDPKAPLDDPKHPHVAEVKDKEDIAAFLRASTSYEVYDGEASTAPKASTKASASTDEGAGDDKGDDSASDPYKGLDRDTLAQLYTERFKKGPGNMKAETIAAKLLENDNE